MEVGGCHLHTGVDGTLEVARYEGVDVFLAQFGAEIACLIDAVFGKFARRLTLHDAVYVVNGLAVTYKKKLACHDCMLFTV